MRIWFFILLIFPLTTMAVELESPKKIVESFFISVKNGNVSSAYDQLFIGSPIPKAKPQAVDLLKQQTKSGLPMYGKIIGHEFIKEEKFGSSLIRFVYILKSEKSPTVWEFFFYKPKKSWYLTNVIFNDQYGLLR